MVARGKVSLTLTRRLGLRRAQVFQASRPLKEGGCHAFKRFKNEQIAFVLRQAKSGAAVDEGCRKRGVAAPTFYSWKKQFVGMGIAEIRRLKQLKDERSKLNRHRSDQPGGGAVDPAQAALDTLVTDPLVVEYLPPRHPRT